MTDDFTQRAAIAAVRAHLQRGRVPRQELPTWMVGEGAAEHPGTFDWGSAAFDCYNRLRLLLKHARSCVGADGLIDGVRLIGWALQTHDDYGVPVEVPEGVTWHWGKVFLDGEGQAIDPVGADWAKRVVTRVFAPNLPWQWFLDAGGQPIPAEKSRAAFKLLFSRYLAPHLRPEAMKILAELGELRAKGVTQ